MDVIQIEARLKNVESWLYNLETRLSTQLNSKPIQRLNALRDECHNMAKEKGWHNPGPTFGEAMALLHSEVSEALEAYREFGNTEPRIDLQGYDGVDSKPIGVPSELADVIIRCLDTCGAFNIDIEEAVRRKMEYNATRDRRHGGKVL